jgi:hypothetical protein
MQPPYFYKILRTYDYLRSDYFVELHPLIAQTLGYGDYYQLRRSCSFGESYIAIFLIPCMTVFPTRAEKIASIVSDRFWLVEWFWVSLHVSDLDQ